ncbi:MAG: hypothetical protein ACKOUR_10490, partial [Planctomycetota bacterium]
MAVGQHKTAAFCDGINRRSFLQAGGLAMQLVKPGGMLLTCSCAGLLSEEEFQKLLYSASRQAGP